MAIVNKFNVNNKQVTLDADIIENMSANDVSYNSSLQYDENTVGNKLSELDGYTKEVTFNEELKSSIVNSAGSVVTNSSFHVYKYDVSQYTSVSVLLPSTVMQDSPYTCLVDESYDNPISIIKSSTLRTEKNIAVDGQKYLLISVANATTASTISVVGKDTGMIEKLNGDISNINDRLEYVEDTIGGSTEIIPYRRTMYVLNSSYKLISTSASVSAMVFKVSVGDIIKMYVQTTVTVGAGYTTEDIEGKTEAELSTEAFVFRPLSTDKGHIEISVDFDGYIVVNTYNNDIVITKENRISRNDRHIGNLDNLLTDEKKSLVGAINEIKSNGGKSEDVGDLNDLDTVDKSSVVAAINEVKGSQYTPHDSFSGLATTNIVGIDDDAELGNELLSETAVILGEGWSGNLADGFTATSATGSLQVNVPELEAGALYQVSFVLNPGYGSLDGYSPFYITLGGSNRFNTYKGTIVNRVYGIIAVNNNKLLVFSPSYWKNGTIKNLSLRKVNNSFTPHFALKDSANNIAAFVNVGKAVNKSIIINSTKSRQFWGEGNAALGYGSMSHVTSGFWNSALGEYALEDVENGSRCIAIGYIALRHNNSGDRNIAIGTFCMEGLTTGTNNIGLGADCMQGCNGNHNIAMGTRAGIGISTGDRNVALASETLTSIGSGKANVAVGDSALAKKGASDYNTALGVNANGNSTSGGYNTAVGGFALQNVNGSKNVAIGYQAGWSTRNYSNSIMLGAGVNATKSNQMVLGSTDITEVVMCGNKKIIFNEDGSVTWEQV